MGLPSLATPKFNTTIPSTGQEIEYRPFLVKEEKVLLMALEGGDQKEISKATQNIIKSCVLSDINIDKLATFDIEYLFLKLRGKSVGELVELQLGHSDSECDHKTEIQINLDEIEVVGDISDGKIMIDDKEDELVKVGSVKGSYASLLTWRHQFVHDGTLPNQATFNESLKAYELGKEVIVVLQQTLQPREEEA